MAQDIIMPRLSDSMEEGTILKWLKAVGDEVKVGEELVEIETDKANMVYEADVAGSVIEILLEEGGSDEVGAVIARVGGADEKPQGKGAAEPKAEVKQDAPEAPAEESAPAEAPAAAEPAAAPAAEPAPAAESGDRVKASPLARRVAADRGVELAGLAGSGPGGRVIKNDVEAAASTPAAAAAPVASAAPVGTPQPGETAKGVTSIVELSKLQQVIARRMSESKAVVPHFYLQSEIDMTAAVEGRKRLKAAATEGQAVPSFNDMVIKACALALKEFPVANGSYKDGKFELYSRVNIGVAVAAQGALVVPTVFDADQKGLNTISSEVKTLAKKVRDGSITPPELSGGTFTVSNLGMYGISNFHAIVNAPHAAILAVGAITEKPVVRNGEITTAHLMGVTLSCDHRILYGADAAEFLGRIRQLLEEPLSLAL